MRVHSETIIELPWLAPYDKIMAEVGYGGAIIKTTAPAGSDVATNIPQKQARVRYDNGRIRAWDGDAAIDIDPSGPSWRVEWRVPGTLDKIVLAFEPFEEQDDEADEGVLQTAQIYSEDFEGQESRFADFVRLMKDPLINPDGFDLEDGLYRQESGSIKFEISFSVPSFRARPDTLPAELSFPYMTDLGVNEALNLPDRNGTTNVQPGFYRATVNGFNIHSGEALHIHCKALGNSGSGTFNTNGETLTQLIHEGSVEIMRIVQDRRPNY